MWNGVTEYIRLPGGGGQRSRGRADAC